MLAGFNRDLRCVKSKTLCPLLPVTWLLKQRFDRHNRLGIFNVAILAATILYGRNRFW